MRPVRTSAECGLVQEVSDGVQVVVEQTGVDVEGHRRRGVWPPGRDARKPHSGDWNPPDSRGEGRDDEKRARDDPVPIDSDRPQVADRLRAENPDAPTYVADARPGYPCRQCLRDAEIGDELILVSWDPFTADTPYRSASPIFLHKEPCPAPTMAAVPEQLTVRQLSVRAFDGDQMMIDAAIVEGSKLEETLERFFAQPDCDHVHVHNATRGCWATRVDRVSAG